MDAKGCDPERLRRPELLRGLCETVVKELSLHVVGEPLWHAFGDPGGVTGIYLLSESHLACHTYPESGWASFNLYCCRPVGAWPWEERLRGVLRADRVSVIEVDRG